jgi:NTP pyrophosphatase (non-canonical NTP hydrolase)
MAETLHDVTPADTGSAADRLMFPQDERRLTAVLCGSFRRDSAGLRQAYEVLRQHTNLLSPLGVDFLDPAADFVRLPHEAEDAVDTVEERHLAAITSADYVWLHAPGGYVGSSASLEIGHAHALGIPVFSDTAPTDETLAAFVLVVQGPADVPSALRAVPGKGLRALQRYYGRMAERRGWSGETAQDTLLLLTEELGELARAVRKTAGLRRDGDYPAAAVEQELADVQLYLVHLANTLGVDIAEAVTAKENDNARRFSESQRIDVA